jgi:hypothetical protein
LCILKKRVKGSGQNGVRKRYREKGEKGKKIKKSKKQYIKNMKKHKNQSIEKKHLHNSI